MGETGGGPRSRVDLDALPLRFSPPDGWTMPAPEWISLYQGYQPPEDWRPYPGAPPIPPSWPWWEENGSSWYQFFRDRAPMPARSLGNWFSLAALGLFLFAVSPFALTGWFIAIGGLVSVTFMILGVRGVIRTVKRQALVPSDPLDTVRAWASGRRNTYFEQAYLSTGRGQGVPVSLPVFIETTVATWWGESSAGAES